MQLYVGASSPNQLTQAAAVMNDPTVDAISSEPGKGGLITQSTTEAHLHYHIDRIRRTKELPRQLTPRGSGEVM